MGVANSNALREGTRVLDYQIGSVLGSGGFGITYQARDLELDSVVAIKEYFPAALAMRMADQTVASRPDGTQGGFAWGLDKFIDEAIALAQMRHSNIVVVNDRFNGNGTAYMALEFVDGPTLKTWLHSIKRVPEQEELDLLLWPLLSALEAVHAKGLLHRDVAPKNIMIDRDFKPVLIDFGAARQLVAERSQTFAAVLTPGYAPLEQYVASAHRQGPWTDIYSLAATFYEAIAGQPPPEAPARAQEDPCTPAVDLGRGRYRQDFLQALDWGLKPLSKDRPQSVAALRRALHATPQQVRGLSTARGNGKSWIGGWFGRS